MKITQDMLLEICRLHDEGWEPHAIARKMGLRRGTVANKINLLQRAGDSRINRGRVEWSDNDSLYVLQQRDAGVTNENIGRALGKPQEIISTHYNAIKRDLEESERA